MSFASESTPARLGVDRIERLAERFVSRRVPRHFRSDKGSEFTAKMARAWKERLGIRNLLIEPGSPWVNGRCWPRCQCPPLRQLRAVAGGGSPPQHRRPVRRPRRAATSNAIEHLQPRGELFVSPGDAVKVATLGGRNGGTLRRSRASGSSPAWLCHGCQARTVTGESHKGWPRGLTAASDPAAADRP